MSEPLVLTLKIDYMSGEGEMHPFRVITVPASYTLYQFTETILTAFQMELTHSFGYYDNDENWKKSEITYELDADLDNDGAVDGVKSVTVEKAFPDIGKGLMLLHNYGEPEKFWVELRVVSHAKLDESYPVLEDAMGVGSDEVTVPPPEELHYYDLEELALERVAKIFQVESKDDLPDVKPRYLEIYYDYLIHQVKFPFQGTFALKKDQDAPEEYKQVEALEILDPDETPDLDRWGLICHVHMDEQLVKIPLAEIVINQGDKNYDLVEDYCIWFWHTKD